jgi:hypothetical protein
MDTCKADREKSYAVKYKKKTWTFGFVLLY